MENKIYNLYNVRGEKILSLEEFILEYSNIYYYINDYRDEENIDELLLKTERLTIEDYVYFLKWKVGEKK